MKKIIYIANVRIPTEKAHGLQIMKMCEAFAASGREVELITPARLNAGFKNVDPFSFFKVRNIFRIHRIITIDPRFLLKFPAGFYIKFQSLFFIFGLVAYLLMKLDRHSSIIYTRDHYLLPVLKYFSDQLVFEIHDMPSKPKKYISVFEQCFKIVAITQGLKEELVNLGISEQKIIVAPDAVDLKDFEIADDKNEVRQKLGLPLNQKLAVYTGHLYDWKGADTLAHAVKYFNEDASAVFVGGTDSDIKHFKNQFSNNDKIIIVGRVDHKLIPSYLKAADVLVLPNSAKSKISKLYTSPMKLFEYMASGAPIVASSLPSIREVVGEQEVQFFEPDSAVSLAEAIKKVLADISLGERLAQQARRVVSQFTWDQRAKKIISTFNE
ncbi:MAG: glycosyltransferase family 4 protein [Candidatus Buchananbacteria bacterium]|nr:glycosyltransferase family 4 protein [Candidatus Buchananbacteria bacterium]